MLAALFITSEHFLAQSDNYIALAFRCFCFAYSHHLILEVYLAATKF